ncbi:MAG: rhamnose transport system permease protein [Streptosporangiaceae bacterium]|jgi:rhamnose transport system permease protein|nr:rhamnose transport system permease protein [Streptosporangiaceae bacterium]
MRLVPAVRAETAAKVGGLVLLLVVELAVFTVLSPDFLTSSNLFNVMALDTENGIIALGMAIVIASGGIDLSVGSILALSSVTMGYAVQHGQPVAVAAVVCLLTGLVCGLINGVLVVVLRLHPLLVTLGTLALYRGLALGISNGNGFSGFPVSFQYFGQTYIGPVPAQVIVWLLIALAVYGVVNATPAGRRLLAVGINELAASFAGIRVGAVRLAVYGTSGLLTGVASLIYASRVFSDRGDTGTGLELLAIAAVVVGGASIRGGEISVARTTLAVIVIGVIPDGLQLAGIDTSWQYVTIGVVMVAAIVINELFAGRASALWRRAPWRRTEMEDAWTDPAGVA